MHLSSLNIDVLLHLIKFVDPVDRFNLVLSGIFKGFENVNKGINLQHRIKNCEIVLGPCWDSRCRLEIRSLKIIDPGEGLNEPCISPRKVFQLLVEEGFLKNNRELVTSCYWTYIPRFLEDVCSMMKLEKLALYNSKMKLEQLPPIFKSCPKLVRLRLELCFSEKLEMNEHLENELRRGFQRLQLFQFQGHIDHNSWPVIQQMLTWLEKCVELSVWHNVADFTNPICQTESSLPIKPTFAQNLQHLTLVDPPVEFLKWILPACINIHTFYLDSMNQRIDSRVGMVRLNKLKELDVSSPKTSALKEIFRNCHEVEKLNLSVFEAELKDLTELDAENMLEVSLRWEEGPLIEQLLPVIMKWRHLRQLTLDEIPVPSFQVLCDFIMGMEHLTHLHLAPKCNRSNCGQLEYLRGKINECVLPRRHHFKFDLSCTCME